MTQSIIKPVVELLSNPLTSYGSLIRSLRALANTSLMEMSSYLGRTPAELSAIEFGREPITIDVITTTHNFLSGVKGLDVSLLLLWQASGICKSKSPKHNSQNHIADVRNMVWQPIESAPKDGTEILAWRDDCGIFIASYTSLDCFPMSKSEINRLDEETLFAKDWFTQWPQALRLEGSEVPTHWMPLPMPPEAQK